MGAGVLTSAFDTWETPSFDGILALRAGCSSPSTGFGELPITGWGGEKAINTPVWQSGGSRDLVRSRWERPGGSSAKEAMHTQPGAGEGAFIPTGKISRDPKSLAGFFPSIHSFVNGYFSANKFNIYFQQVAGGR